MTLYNNFIVCMMCCAFFALLNMIDEQEWQYIVLPIGILIWGFFKFFDENDREYLIREGYDPDTFNGWLSEDSNRYSTTSYQGRSNYTLPADNATRTTWQNSQPAVSRQGGATTVTWVNRGTEQDYKHLVSKCRRNFNIAIGKDE